MTTKKPHQYKNRTIQKTGEKIGLNQAVVIYNDSFLNSHTQIRTRKKAKDYTAVDMHSSKTRVSNFVFRKKPKERKKIYNSYVCTGNRVEIMTFIRSL